jgi:hypothetical protein
MSNAMIAFVVGFVLGGWVGFIGAALCAAARRTDNDLEARTKSMEEFLKEVRHD